MPKGFHRASEAVDEHGMYWAQYAKDNAEHCSVVGHAVPATDRVTYTDEGERRTSNLCAECADSYPHRMGYVVVGREPQQAGRQEAAQLPGISAAEPERPAASWERTLKAPQADHEAGS
jgi:hypothetical protein